MNAFVSQVQKRGSGLGRGFAHAIDGSDDELAMGTGSVVEAKPSSAWFLVSDESVDRDGDEISIAGINTDNWFNNNANWFLNHESKAGEEIGSSINPKTGSLDIRKQGSKFFACCHFFVDMPGEKGERARFIASQVAKKRIRSCSIAFVPLEGERRQEDYYAAKARTDKFLPNGMSWQASDVTEISIVGIGANAHSLLQMANDKSCPATVAKSLRKCVGKECCQTKSPLAKELVDATNEMKRSAWLYVAKLRAEKMSDDLTRTLAKTGTYLPSLAGYRVRIQSVNGGPAVEQVFIRGRWTPFKSLGSSDGGTSGGYLIQQESAKSGLDDMLRQGQAQRYFSPEQVAELRSGKLSAETRTVLGQLLQRGILQRFLSPDEVSRLLEWGKSKNSNADIEAPGTRSPGTDPMDHYQQVLRCSKCNKVGPARSKCICGGSFVKGMLSDESGPTDETGEAALVDEGHVPDDSTRKQDGSEDPDRAEILERYGDDDEHTEDEEETAYPYRFAGGTDFNSVPPR